MDLHYQQNKITNIRPDQDEPGKLQNINLQKTEEIEMAQQLDFDYNQINNMCLSSQRDQEEIQSNNTSQRIEKKQRESAIDNLEIAIELQQHIKLKDMPQRNSTILNEEGYFDKDSENSIDEKGDDEPQNNDTKIFIKQNQRMEYRVRFRYKFFFEFFLYHILNYIILGPLSLLVLWWKPGKILLRNMWFIGQKSLVSYTVYALNSISLYFYFAYDSKNIFFMSEIVFLFLFMTLRIIIVANQYATFSPAQIQQLQNQEFDIQGVAKDFFLNEWTNQTNRIIHDETYFIIQKHEIEQAMFYFNFLADPGQNLADKINEGVLVLSDYHPQGQNDVFQPDPINTHNGQNQIIFFGYGIIKEFIDYIQIKQKQLQKRSRPLLVIIILIRTLVPSFFRLRKGVGFFGDSWNQICVAVLTMLINFQTHAFLMIYLSQMVYDLRRQKLMLNQCSYLISPRKLNYIDEQKILPTIDIFCRMNLKAWEILRQISFEYGEGYFVRVLALKGIMVLIVFGGLICIFLNVFKVITIQTPFMIMLSMDACVIFVIMFMMMKYSADINKTFQDQLNIIFENKSIIEQLVRCYDVYFKGDFKSQKFIYRHVIKKFNSVISCTIERETYLKSLMDDFQLLFSNLEYEEKTNGFKIFGVLITWGLIQSICAGILSAVGTIIYQLITGNN